MAEIRIELPPDRDRPGQVTLLDDQGKRVAGPFPAYGRADSRRARLENNKSRDPILPFGDTPDGEYRALRAVSTGKGTRYHNLRTYGPNGAIVLEPISGDALRAKNNGRSGLLIHGGDLRSDGALRAMNGCVRLSNDNMAALLTGIAQIMRTGDGLVCRAVPVGVVVEAPVDPNSSDDAGDPPPGIKDILENTPYAPRAWPAWQPPKPLPKRELIPAKPILQPNSPQRAPHREPDRPSRADMPHPSEYRAERAEREANRAEREPPAPREPPLQREPRPDLEPPDLTLP